MFTFIATNNLNINANMKIMSNDINLFRAQGFIFSVKVETAYAGVRD